jgi:hypothetical protein
VPSTNMSPGASLRSNWLGYCCDRNVTETLVDARVGGRDLLDQAPTGTWIAVSLTNNCVPSAAVEAMHRQIEHVFIQTRALIWLKY